MDAALHHTGTHSSSHGIAGLDPESYTAHKLKHSSPEHLHLTTRRFFIGPIPEGWLNSNRKSWYRRRLELSSYSSKNATFHAAAGQSHHQRTKTAIDPSTKARMNYSFPQPEDIEDSADEQEDAANDTAEDDDDDEDEEQETKELEPVSTMEVLQPPNEPGNGVRNRSRSPRTGQKKVPSYTLDGPPAEDLETSPRTRPVNGNGVQIQITRSGSDSQPRFSNEASALGNNRTSATVTRESSLRQNGFDVQHDNVDAGSRTALLPPGESSIRPKTRDGAKSLDKHEPAPIVSDDHEPKSKRRQSPGVRFKVSDAVADGQRRVGRRAGNARQRVGRRMARRQTLREGTIVKMEKMLVRMDATLQQVPEYYDENDSMKTATTQVEKWKEYMVVARKSKKGDEDDYRLQFYDTRVIPEVEDISTKKKPKREIKLIKKTAHVNMFSSLDKSLVVWHPYKKGTRITIMKCESPAHSVEWYSFLRDALGWKRPDMLQVSVPDLGVVLQIERPFDDLERAAREEEDEEAAIAKVAEAEQAVAGRIVSQCLEMLEGNPEWTSIVHQWHENFRPGLAWKRYDRLEWIHGVNEQKMYGTMAMQHSYELELRPKVHYPQHATGKKGKHHEEPPPVEGFLIRMTSQKGVHKRIGKTFFKRLYYSTHDNFLAFSRPAAATPPHPPRLQTISGSNIPSSNEIIQNTPIMYDIDPFDVDESEPRQIKWLDTEFQDRIERRDREAYEEARRNHANLSASDGYINMMRIKKVRPMRWGSDSADDALDSGSDADFHEDIVDSSHHDGTTTKIDNDRTFELILENGLVVRLQAYDGRTRNEWISRLRKLVKYWKLRKIADMNNFKSVRATNLHNLKIDEDVEAELGQFGHKWEVTRSEASPQLYNVCSIAACRTISLSGFLYRKARRHGTFQRCGVILAGGKMLIYQSTLRKTSGQQVAHIHQEKQQVIDLQGCYVYSGLIVEDDLLYQNRTFDANHIGTMASLPRVWTEDGWTSTDVDVMCCFVVWMNTRKGWFRTAGNMLGQGQGQTQTQSQAEASESEGAKGQKRAKIKRVRQLGVPGKGMVFKCRSRAERDLWVLNLGIEIERLVEKQRWEEEESGEGQVRFAT